MKYLLLATLFISVSCAAFKPTEDQKKCYKDFLTSELFVQRSQDEKTMVLESLEDRRQVTVEINADRFEERSCTLRDQFRTQH